MTPGTNWIPDDQFLSRVKRAYRIGLDGFDIPSVPPWSGIFGMQKPVHDALLSDDHAELRAIFNNPGKSNLYYGVDNLCSAVLPQMEADPEIDAGCANESRAHIMQIGIELSLNAVDPEDILKSLDAFLGTRISFPNPFYGEAGLDTSRGVASYRAVHAIYHAVRIKTLASPSPQPRVLEIGPGMGRTAYYSFLAGIRDYSTIDLPMGAVAQACFLGATVGPENIWLAGDPDGGQEKIKIFPSNHRKTLTGSFDVVFNSDSIVEMGLITALSYGAIIRKRGKKFLSINHRASPANIPRVAILSFPWRKCVSKPFPMRDGYFEDVFY